MSTLQNITLTQFRNFNFAAFDFQEKVVGITGLNGIGKTNLLDAIYYLCFTKSYFQSRDKYNVQHEQNGFRISGVFGNKEVQKEVTCVWKEGKKTISLDKAPYDKVSDHIGKYAAVMIAPDDSEILTGSGETRRKFFDGILSLKDDAYLNHLLQYAKILQQKNAYLKLQHRIDHQLLDIYDAQLITHGSYIIQKRMEITDEFPQWLQYYYEQVSSNKNEIPYIKYSANTPVAQLPIAYHTQRNREIEAKRTLVGPHLDDWQLFINDSQCKVHASQGQKKSYLISLKLSQIKLLSKEAIKPILLLDDIFEKLDPVRLSNLFKLLEQLEFAQIFMTHTNAKDIQQITHGIYDQIQIAQL